MYSSCYRFSLNKRTWYSAKSDCEASGSRLAVLNTEEVQQALVGALSFHYVGMTWIGLHRDPKSNSQWLWVDGSSADYTNWAQGEPNNEQGTEDCVGIPSSLAPANWSDLACDISLFYVCELTIGK